MPINIFYLQELKSNFQSLFHAMRNVAFFRKSKHISPTYPSKKLTIKTRSDDTNEEQLDG